MRMLHNNLDPEVAERPDHLVVYGGNGRAARSWAAFDAIVRLAGPEGPDETLLVQSGKPVGVLRTHERAPRVLIANSHLVPKWATWEDFRRLEQLGLIMYGQMTAGSWIYIGTQGILQGTYETFAAVAAKRFGGTLAGTITLTAGLGGMGGAQPLAVTMNGGVVICVEVDQARITGGSSTATSTSRPMTSTHAVRRAVAARDKGGRCRSACSATPPTSSRPCSPATPPSTSSPTRPRRTTRSTTCRRASRSRTWASCAPRTPKTSPAGPANGRARRAMVGFLDKGAEVFDYGNSIRGEAELAGYTGAFDFPGFVRGLHQAVVLRGQGPVPLGRAVRRPRGHRRHRPGRPRPVPDDEALARWTGWPRRRSTSRGSRPGSAGSATASATWPGCVSTTWSRRASVSAHRPGRDHLDCGSVASPYRETEAMADGSDAIADWPLLNALVNTASGASWVSVHHGGGVGIGSSIHAGEVSWPTGADAGARVDRVLTNDPAMGVIRHADAGYEQASAVAAERGVRVPMAER